MRLPKILTALVLCLASAGTANAASILYRNDLVKGTDYLGQAVNSGAYTVTSTNGSISSFTLTDFDVVVYANQNSAIPVGDLDQLNAFIAGGGRVIFDDWKLSNDFNGNENFTGDTNQTELTLSLFSAGIASPLAVTNQGWGIFSTSLSLLSGGVAGGTFGDGSIAIVVGNSGHTIVNGFLSDTVASEQLYLNELSSLVSTAAVPEPATLALVSAGVVGLGALRRRKKKAD